MAGWGSQVRGRGGEERKPGGGRCICWISGAETAEKEQGQRLCEHTGLFKSSLCPQTPKELKVTVVYSFTHFLNLLCTSQFHPVAILTTYNTSIIHTRGFSLVSSVSQILEHAGCRGQKSPSGIWGEHTLLINVIH